VVLADEEEQQLHKSKMSSTSRSSINEEEDSEEIGAQLHKSKMSSTSRSSINEEEDSEEIAAQLHKSKMSSTRRSSINEEEDSEEIGAQLHKSKMSSTRRSSINEEEDLEEIGAQLHKSKMSSTSRRSINEEEDSEEIGAGGYHSEVEYVMQHTPQHLHIDPSLPVPYDEREQDQEVEEEHHPSHPSPLEAQYPAYAEQVSTMVVEDYEDVFDGLDDDDDDDDDDDVTDRDNGEDQIIGTLIQYDITSDMLRQGGIPENSSRTKLRSLQRTESYEVSLLDSHVEHSESSSDPSLEFGTIDQFGDFGALDDWKAQDEWKPEEEEPRQVEEEEDKDMILNSSLVFEEQEDIEIVFYEEGEELEYEEKGQAASIFNLESFYIENLEDNVEMRFFNCREDEDTDTGSSKFDDCYSGEVVPSPSPDVKNERKHPLLHLIDLEKDEWSLDTPPYDWFLPEHTDNVTPIKHTPNYLVIKKDLVNSRSTPDTAQTEAPSFEESDHGDHHSLFSHGSAVSEAIQDLVALCRSKRLFEV
jgi:hypothetical protein